MAPSNKSVSNVQPFKGWIYELEEAEALSRRQPSPSHSIRVARARLKLRQFKKCEKTCKKGLKLATEGSSEQKELEICLRLVQSILQRESSYHSEADRFEALLKKENTKMGIDDCGDQDSEWYSNLNVLHAAACSADLRFVEALARLGAAIDYPVSKETGPHRAPKGLTALHFACARVLMASYYQHYYKVKGQPWSEENERIATRCVDIAVVLIRLGADFTKPMHYPNPELLAGNEHDFLGPFDFHGMSPKDMARKAKNAPILGAIELMEQDRLGNAWCRCGSRLPWKDCHASPHLEFHHPHFILEDNKGTKTSESTDGGENKAQYWFRHSPLAVCICGNSNKTYYTCCWRSLYPRYSNDNNGNVVWPYEVGDKTADPSANDGDERHKEVLKLAAIVRESGMATVVTYAELYRGFKHIKSQLLLWDKEVYASVMERIPRPNGFTWLDLHWDVDKEVLIRRTKDWNDALVSYCDEKGLKGTERDKVIARHTANPLAPCGHPFCDQWESTIKEYKLCSRCCRIAYCGRACQASHWKEHKKTCKKAFHDRSGISK